MRIISRSGKEAQLKFVQVPWDMFCNKTGDYSSQVKLAVITKFVIPCLQTSREDTVRSFLLANLEMMIDKSNLNYEFIQRFSQPDKDEKNKRQKEEKVITALVEFIGALKLFTIMYQKLPQVYVHALGGFISQPAARILR